MLGGVAAATGAAVGMGAGAALGKFAGTLGSSGKGKGSSCDEYCGEFEQLFKACFAAGKSAEDCKAAEDAHLATYQSFGLDTGMSKQLWKCELLAAKAIPEPTGDSTCKEIFDWGLQVRKAGLVGAEPCIPYNCFQV